MATLASLTSRRRTRRQFIYHECLQVWPSLTVGLLTHLLKPQIRSRDSDVRLRSLDAHIGNPEDLAVDLDAFQTAAPQLLFGQSQESEVRQVTKHRLEPSVLREDLANTTVKEFVGVEGQHRDVLRSPGRGNRIKHRLGQVLAEEDPVLLEFQDFRDLFMNRQTAQPRRLCFAQPGGTGPV